MAAYPSPDMPAKNQRYLPGPAKQYASEVAAWWTADAGNYVLDDGPADEIVRKLLNSYIVDGGSAANPDAAGVERVWIVAHGSRAGQSIFWYSDDDHAQEKAYGPNVPGYTIQSFIDRIVQHPTVQAAREIIFITCQSGSAGGVCQMLSSHASMRDKTIMGCQTNATPSGKRPGGQDLLYSLYRNNTQVGEMLGTGVMSGLLKP